MKKGEVIFLKKILIAILSITIAFVLFGCVQREFGAEVSTDLNTSITEKGNLDNLEETTSYNGETTQAVENETSVAEDNHTTEVTSVNKNKNETTSVNQTTNGTETTKSSEQNDELTTTNSNGATMGDKTNTDVAETTQNNAETFFTVTFKSYDGKILKTEKVKKGEDATAPEPPKRDGYIFVKWDTYYKSVKTDITVNAVYKEITEPTLIVDSVKATDKDVVVKVSAVNNPGLLALVLKITYDEDVMSLKNVESGVSMNDYTFTAPKNKKSGCNAAWNIIDVPENAADGEIAVLHFEIAEDANPGDYDVSVSCYDGAFDSNYEPVKFSIINGSVNII